MSRVTRTLASVTLATGIAAAAFVPATTASAMPATATGDSLVNIEKNNVVIQPNVPIAVAANVCNINVAAVAKVDNQGGKTECKALSTASSKAWVTNN
jgi:hypothetical protein